MVWEGLNISHEGSDKKQDEGCFDGVKGGEKEIYM